MTRSLSANLKKSIYTKTKLFWDRSNKNYKFVKNVDAAKYAAFLGYLIATEKIVKPFSMVDLMFGGGSLTSHIILDNNLELKSLTLNDKSSDAFFDLKTYFTSADFKKVDILEELSESNWGGAIEKFDCIVLNPLIVDGNESSTSCGVFDISLIDKNFYQNLEALTHEKSFIVLLGYDLERKFKKLFESYKERFIFSKKSGPDCVVLKKSEKTHDHFFEWDKTLRTVTERKSFNRNLILNDFWNINEESERLQAAIFNNSFNIPGFILSSAEPGGYDTSFPYRNILFQGVPGTGKSRAVDRLIQKSLKLRANNTSNVLRISVHSATTNSDLMQGIEVSTKGGNVIYSEKTGIILRHIGKACQYPNQPFVLILEEIQENSLNELLGDLIYLLEDNKRANLAELIKNRNFLARDFFDLIDQYIQINPNLNYVTIPNLISGGDFRKILIPTNFYIFCTSNYRPNKKIIEDNLFRRFTVIELGPNFACINNSDVREFFEEMNNHIVSNLSQEEMPDRFRIGHADWMDVSDELSFVRALYRAYIELRDVRNVLGADLEVIFSDLKKINSSAIFIKNVLSKMPNTCCDIADFLQKNAYADIFEVIK